MRNQNNSLFHPSIAVSHAGRAHPTLRTISANFLQLASYKNERACRSRTRRQAKTVYVSLTCTLSRSANKKVVGQLAGELSEENQQDY